MTNLRELEKRLEEATGGSEDLNIEILHVLHDHGGFAREMVVVPNFTASLDAAVALVERVLPGWYWASHSSQYWDNGRPADKCFLGGVYDASPPEINGKNFVVHKQTAALALCLALIRALIAKGDRHD